LKPRPAPCEPRPAGAAVRGQLLAAVLRAVRDKPGRTAAQLTDAVGGARLHCLLGQLERAGKLYRDGEHWYAAGTR
jgi:hypothetical protein